MSKKILIIVLGIQTFSPLTASVKEDVSFLRETLSPHKQNLIFFIHLKQRYPQWLLLFPQLFHAVQKEAEKKTLFDPSISHAHKQEIRTFFKEKNPLTFQGWQIWHQILEGNSDSFKKALKKLWMNISLSSSLQKKILKSFSSFLSQEDHIRRYKKLIWHKEEAMAKELLSLVPSSHHYQEVHKETHPFYYRRQVETFIKQSQPEKALPFWKKLVNLSFSDKDLSPSEIALTLHKKELSLMRDFWQAGRTHRCQGLEEEAQKMFKMGLSLRSKGMPVSLWPEYLWLRGLMLGEGLGQWEEAKSLFLILAHYPSLDAPLKKVFSGFVTNQQEEPSIHLAMTPKIRQRYQARSYFWAGLFCEKQGKMKEARNYFQKAAPYSFFFYGQMALYKLGQSVTMKFPLPQGKVSPLYEKALTILPFWKKEGNSWPSHTHYLAKDLVLLSHSPLEKKKTLDLLKELSPSQVTYIAKTWTYAQEAIFPHAYPLCSLPRNARDSSLVYGIILAETCFNPSIISTAGAKGIMQIMPFEAASLAKKANVKPPYDPLKDGLYNPKERGNLMDQTYNLHLGITEIEDKLSLLKSYPLAIAGYNAGTKKAKQWLEAFYKKDKNDYQTWLWIETIPYEETRHYVQRVLEHRAIYRWLQGKPLTPPEVESSLNVL